MEKASEDYDEETAPELKDQIQRNLRALYDETLSEELPDKFVELLKKLEKQDKA